MFLVFVAKLEFRNAHRLADIHQRNMEKFDGHFCIFLEARKESSANSDSLAAGHELCRLTTVPSVILQTLGVVLTKAQGGILCFHFEETCSYMSR